MKQENENKTVQKDVRIDGTTFHVTSVYKGTEPFEKALYDWAIRKTIAAQTAPKN